MKTYNIRLPEDLNKKVVDVVKSSLGKYRDRSDWIRAAMLEKLKRDNPDAIEEAAQAMEKFGEAVKGFKDV
jgi:Arc/MetJ-type ribon-helix-helix transcriptional regulator